MGDVEESKKRGMKNNNLKSEEDKQERVNEKIKIKKDEDDKV